MTSRTLGRCSLFTFHNHNDSDCPDHSSMYPTPVTFHISLLSLHVKFSLFIHLSIIILSGYARYLLTKMRITVLKLTSMN